jgi:ParB/RepB/Spo0J family partition protein
MIQELPIGALVPNDYNPNRMSDAEYAELVTELRRYQQHPDQGQRPAPVVVRSGPKPDTYVIVDGEHRWRAAREIGLNTVPCEIIDVDDTEARRQTYKRNRHGNDNQVRLGRMFEHMWKQGNGSLRELAEQLDISEGTVRNALKYSHAAELRNGYAPDGTVQVSEAADEAIGRLTVKQVRLYVKLSNEVRDLWVDYGCSLDLARKHKKYADVWPGVGAYLQVLRELKMETKLVDRVPGKTEPRERTLFGAPYTVEEFIPHITPAQWREVLEQGNQYATEFWQGEAVESALAVLKRQKSIPDGTDPFAALVREQIKAAPAYLQRLDFLTLQEQEFLVNVGEHEDSMQGILVVDYGTADGLSPAEVEAVKREVIKVLRWRQDARDAARIDYSPIKNAKTLSGVAEAQRTVQEEIQEKSSRPYARLVGRHIEEIWLEAVRQHKNKHVDGVRRAILEDRATLIKQYVEQLRETSAAFKTANIGGRPASDVLETRLDALPWAELRLLIGLALWPDMNPMDLWARRISNGPAPVTAEEPLTEIDAGSVPETLTKLDDRQLAGMAEHWSSATDNEQLRKAFPDGRPRAAEMRQMIAEEIARREREGGNT